ncbi:Mannitol repressor [Tardiphaga sp. OK246]|uniref:MltR family transcriptional regulator n=1 Tax=Tardiphaga sp. OK246 TaxID=1855307 RepID=UPI000B62A609|nr:MltR family transcriptional regulator [Tardiphaga sp. OK246]SNT01784.1 Mannitol repressor [Tardiphaga sp. OK246]
MGESLKKYLKSRPSDQEIGAIFFEMGDDGARGCALAGAAVLEDVLRGAIEHRFSHMSEKELAELFDGTAPLSTFSAKIKIAYAMGIIGKLTRHDLEKLREIRNAFAHSIRHLSFDLPEIANIVESFNALKDSPEAEKFSVQHKFVTAATSLMMVLVGKIHTPPYKVAGKDHLD